MDTITIALSEEETARLEKIAAHEGQSPADLAANAVREKIADDVQWELDVRDAIAEIERGDFLTLDELKASIETTLNRASKARG